METRELLGLMIGDVLMAYHDDGESQRNFPVIVDGLDENGTLVDGGCYISWKPMRSEDCSEEYADELNPIPLTPEILEKNGFVKHDKIHPYYLDYYHERDGFTIFNSSAWHGHILNSVHELQHALRLCGLNDLADNFKV